jgi:hypothetical protein
MPGPSPTPSITLASPTIVTVKVSARPRAMPTGRRRPPVAPALSSAGSTGSTHGLSAVPAPASSAKTTRRAIPKESRARAKALRRAIHPGSPTPAAGFARDSPG